MASAIDWEALPLFRDLGAADRDALSRICRVEELERGAILFSQGDPASGFHVVLEGKIRVYKSSPEGKEQTLHIWGPGEPVGEVAVLRGEAYPAEAQALEDCRVLRVPRAGLLHLVRTDPEFALRFLSVLALRLSRFAAQVESLTLKEVPGRLASYLLLLDEEQGLGGRVELDLAKAMVANLLGTIPETLSRVLGRMTREGLIAPEGARGIRLLDPEGLRALSEGTRRLG